MQQASFFPTSKLRREHGGSLAIKKRRSRRAITIKQPVHLTLRSDLAQGTRSLIKNRDIVERVAQCYSKRFRIRIYEKAICGNHLHLLVRAQTRRELQYFFRVFAGQVAQEILLRYPLTLTEKQKRGGTPNAHPKNRRTFWEVLIYSRIVSWGREFRIVKAYVIQNTLEANGIIAYKMRRSKANDSRMQQYKQEKLE